MGIASIHSQSAEKQDYITAIRDDEFSKLHLDNLSFETVGLFLMFFSECGESAPARLLEASLIREDMATWCRNIAQALAAGDNIQLASAIDEAEAHQLIVHAARMRVILAERTGDRTHLERARPVLEELGDRRFMRKLEKVESELGPQMVG